MDDRTRRLQASATALILEAHTEPSVDIAKERSNATFPCKELAHWLAGSEKKYLRKQELSRLLEGKDWADKSRRYFYTREEEHVNALRASTRLWDLVQSGGFSLQDAHTMRGLLDFPGGLELHIGMWIPALLSTASDEQRAKWLPPSQALSIIGTYAQTELGHGTFVRGLETTASYDPSTKEFILHSPTLSATKWWPGGLGKTATHAVTMARLVLRGVDHGPHAFIVQVRDADTHLPCRGITVGDIGPKFGYNGVDNGFMRFDHVRIPADQLLSRFSSVSPGGDYVPPPPSNSKASYATMLYVRATIVEDAGRYLSKAVTIATRYLAVRRQTAAGGAPRELQVLDYQNTSAAVLPLLAAAYATHLAGVAAMRLYKDFDAQRDAGDFSALPELHALLGGLKAEATWVTADGIETCRRLCGGHGYSALSGLPTLLASYVQNVTWEGDNNVLCLQTARFLLKVLPRVSEGGPLPPSVAYLRRAASGARCTVTAPVGWEDPAAQAAALGHVAARLVRRAAEDVAAAGGGGRLEFEGPAWNDNSMALIKAAKAHCQLWIASTFADTLSAQCGGLSRDTQAALADLRALHGVELLAAGSADLLEDGFCSARQAQMLRVVQAALWKRVRLNAVALVDAFGHTDYSLNSAIGREDGDVYRALFDMAQHSPLNNTQEGPGWAAVLQPRQAALASKL